MELTSGVLGAFPRESAFGRLLAAFASSKFTHVLVPGRLILPSLAFVWALCRSTKVFKLRVFSVGVPALMMDTRKKRGKKEIKRWKD